MKLRAFLLLGMLLFCAGCKTSCPSPLGTGSMYQGEINVNSVRGEIFFPWAPFLEGTDDVQQVRRKE